MKYFVSFYCNDIDVVRSNLLKIEDVAVYNKILFSHGPGLPKDYPILFEILENFGSTKSILGVCLGHQAIAEFYGCTLLNLPKVLHGVSSKIKHLNNCSLYRKLPNYLNVAHYHSWVVSTDFLSKDLEIKTFNDDGLIMSFRHRRYSIKSVQYHPESIMSNYGLELIKNWIFD